MKYLFIISLLIFLGCLKQEKEKEIDKLKDATIVRTTYYLKTVVHDEHLFIISNEGHFIHHPECPCLKVIAPKEEPPAPPPKIIFDILNK